MDKIKKVAITVAGTALAGGLALLGAKKLRKGETVDIEEDFEEIEVEETTEEEK